MVRKNDRKKRLKHWVAVLFYRLAKWLQEEIENDFEAPKATVPRALASATNTSICGFCKLRATGAYSAGAQYGAKEYRSHRQVYRR